MKTFYDCIILGAGPAGLSCALYLLRANKDVLVIDNKKPCYKLESIKSIDNYLGFDHISGKELSDKFINHVLGYNKDLIQIMNIQQVYSQQDSFTITDYNQVISCKCLVIATGLSTKKIIDNIDEYEGKGVSYCISCDGFLYKDKNVILVGDSNKLEEMKKEFSSLTTSITTIDTKDLKNPKIVGKNNVEGFINNNKEYKCDGIFIDPLYSSINIDLDYKRNGNYIVVDKNNMTSINKLYAIGDIVDKPLRQVSTAVSDGANAAISIIKNL